MTTLHKVGLAVVQSCHQLSEGDEVDRGHGLAASLLLLLPLLLRRAGRLAGMVEPKVDQQFAARRRLHDLNNRIVDWVLVLLQPVGDVVGHDAGVVGDRKVGVLVRLRLGLQEDRQFAKRCLQLLLEGFVSGLGEEGLLLHDEHVVVEELLELLVDKVDGDLFKAVVFKDLKASNVKHSAEVGFLQCGINKGVIALFDQPPEHAIVDGPGDASHGVGSLLASLALDHPLGANLDPRLAERLDQGERVNLQGSGNFSWIGVWAYELAFSLVVATLGLELNATTGHDGSGQHVAVKLLLGSKAEDVEGILGVLKLLVVVDGVDLGLALRDVDVVVDVLASSALGPQTALADSVSIRLEQLVEDVVGPLDLLLLGDTRLLEQVGYDVTTTELATGGEVDTDEFTESRGVVVPRSLGIAIGLQDRVGGNNLVLQGDLLLALLAAPGGDHGQVGDHLLRVLRLAGAGLASDEHGIVLLVGQHVPVGSLGDSPEMRRHLVPALAQVNLANPVGVQGVPLVRVDDHNEET